MLVRPYFFQGTATHIFMQADRKEFADLLQMMLSLDHKLRIPPSEALAHPFISPAEQLEVLRKQTRERVQACRMRKKEEKEKQEKTREKKRQIQQACRLRKKGQKE
jgi:hypothetical protein